MKTDFFVKTPNGLLPRFESSWYDKVQFGDVIECIYKRPRNVRFHMKFFSMLNIVFENQDVFINIDHMREELTKAAGYYDRYINHKGQECFRAKSISFAAMSEEEFEEFYEAFLKVVYDTWGFDPEYSEEL